METKSQNQYVERVRVKIKFNSCFTVNLVGRKGDLALMQSDTYEVEILNYSHFHIHPRVLDSELKFEWLMTGCYSDPNSSTTLWDLLSSINKKVGKPWCVIRDFNEITSQNEKWGGNLRSEVQMEKFWNALLVNGLSDLGWKGNKFAQSNRHGDESFMKERLDGAVANFEWRERVGGKQVEVISSGRSQSYYAEY